MKVRYETFYSTEYWQTKVYPTFTVHDKLFINKICIDCHPEKTKNQAAKQRRFCFVQDLTGYKSYSLIGKMLKYA